MVTAETAQELIDSRSAAGPRYNIGFDANLGNFDIPSERGDFAQDFLAQSFRSLFMPPESCDFARDFLTVEFFLVARKSPIASC